MTTIIIGPWDGRMELPPMPRADRERLVLEAGKVEMRNRIIDWLRDPSRKPAHLHFTAGPERELADEIEMTIQRDLSKTVN